MSGYVISVIRTIVQAAVGTVFAHFAVNAFAVPSGVQAQVTNWAVSATIAALVTLWVAIVRALEERKGSSMFDTWCRIIGRLLMAGLKTTPQYSPPETAEPTPTVAVLPAPQEA